jgi:hypothetical protein
MSDVLQRSLVLCILIEGNASKVTYQVNNHPYTKGYYLADSIYPPWSTFMKTIRTLEDEKENRFAKEQEPCRKDVERAFCVLQSCCAIVWHPARTSNREQMWEIMTACVIMHNMIIEEERDDLIYDQGWEFHGDLVAHQPSMMLEDRATHNQLQKDLAMHMWNHVGSQ